MNFFGNKIHLDKMQFKNVQICRHFGPPFAPVFPWFGMSCDVDQGTRDFRLDSCRLFYLCKFNLVVHTKVSDFAFNDQIDYIDISFIPVIVKQLGYGVLFNHSLL